MEGRRVKHLARRPFVNYAWKACSPMIKCSPDLEASERGPGQKASERGPDPGWASEKVGSYPKVIGVDQVDPDQLRYQGKSVNNWMC